MIFWKILVTISPLLLWDVVVLYDCTPGLRLGTSLIGPANEIPLGVIMVATIINDGAHGEARGDHPSPYRPYSGYLSLNGFLGL